MKIGHHTKAIAHPNPYFGSKIKIQKDIKIHSTNHLHFFCARKRFKKHQIFEKWDNFKSRPSRKGYSPCKILAWGQKLKLKKTCQNPFYKSFTLLPCKEPLQKKPKYSRNDTILKDGPSCKGYSSCKIILLAQKLKLKKNVIIHCTNHLHFFFAKNPSKRHQIFEKWDYFENRLSCKCYSSCKITT